MKIIIIKILVFIIKWSIVLYLLPGVLIRKIKYTRATINEIDRSRSAGAMYRDEYTTRVPGSDFIANLAPCENISLLPEQDTALSDGAEFVKLLINDGFNQTVDEIIGDNPTPHGMIKNTDDLKKENKYFKTLSGKK